MDSDQAVPGGTDAPAETLQCHPLRISGSFKIATMLTAVWFVLLAVLVLDGTRPLLLALHGGFLVAALAVTAWMYRSGVQVDHRGVAVVGLFRGRRVTWSQLASLKVDWTRADTPLTMHFTERMSRLSWNFGE